jgi:hypothetical protein
MSDFLHQQLGRLAKICALFSSDLPGERSAAGYKADTSLVAVQLTWADVLPEEIAGRQGLLAALAKATSSDPDDRASGAATADGLLKSAGRTWANLFAVKSTSVTGDRPKPMTDHFVRARVSRLHPDLERLALLGWRLHPSSRYTAAACIESAADRATCDFDQLERWCAEFPDCNWRVVMEGSGIWALDVDAAGPNHEADGIKALADLVAVHGQIPVRPATRSGGGGLALFFRWDGEAIVGATGTPAPGIDPRRGRLTVTIPPSIHHLTHKPYRWITPPWELPPPQAPAWLLRLLAPPPAATPPNQPNYRSPAYRSGTADGRQRYAIAALRHAVERVAIAPGGSRNDKLYREACSIMRFVKEGLLDAKEIALALTHAGLQVGLPPREIQATLKSAIGAGFRRT